MNYFKKCWGERRSDAYELWGVCTWYFETDDEGKVLRQIERYELGAVLRYSTAGSGDQYGGLIRQPLKIRDFKEFSIEEQEFESVWGSGKHNLGEVETVSSGNENGNDSVSLRELGKRNFLLAWMCLFTPVVLFLLSFAGDKLVFGSMAFISLLPCAGIACLLTINKALGLKEWETAPRQRDWIRRLALIYAVPAALFLLFVLLWGVE